MKYSLRSLMIVVTLVCVLLGGRIEYLRRRANFHEGEARTAVSVKRDSAKQAYQDAVDSLEHVILASRFRSAIWRPWGKVDTSKPEIPVSDAMDLSQRIAEEQLSDFLEKSIVP